jgi:hypothetical protein
MLQLDAVSIRVVGDAFACIGSDVTSLSAAQNRAVKNLFRGPNLIDDVATTVRGLERGDIKLRVRALEAERALNRVLQQQKVTPCERWPNGVTRGLSGRSQSSEVDLVCA